MAVNSSVLSIFAHSECAWSRFAQSAPCRPQPSIAKPISELKHWGCGQLVNFQDRDNLSTTDKSAAPNVSDIQRFHSTTVEALVTIVYTCQYHSASHRSLVSDSCCRVSPSRHGSGFHSVVPPRVQSNSPSEKSRHKPIIYDAYTTTHELKECYSNAHTIIIMACSSKGIG